MEYNGIEPRRRNKMLTEFETTIKWPYQAGCDRNKRHIVDLLGVADNKEKGIEDSSITLYPYVSRTGPTATPELDQEILTLRQRHFGRNFCADL